MAVTSTEDQINGLKDKKADYTAYRVMWAQGPAKVGYSYEKAVMNQTPNGAAYVASYYSPVKTAAAPTAGDFDTAHNLKTSTLVAAYNFGAVELIGLTGTAKRGNAKDTSISEDKLNQLGAKIPFGKYEVMLNTYTRTNTKDTTATKTADIKGNFVNVNYSFSKRTRAYFTMGTQKDNAGTASAAVTQEIKRNGVGVVHTF
jgi:predicted porin